MGYCVNFMDIGGLMIEQDYLDMKILHKNIGETMNLAISFAMAMLQIEKPDLREFTYLKGKLLCDDGGEYFFSIIHSDGPKIKIPEVTK